MRLCTKLQNLFLFSLQSFICNFFRNYYRINREAIAEIIYRHLSFVHIHENFRFKIRKKDEVIYSYPISHRNVKIPFYTQFFLLKPFYSKKELDELKVILSLIY